MEKEMSTSPYITEGWSIGLRVLHVEYGVGVIRGFEDQGYGRNAIIQFNTVGAKLFRLDRAKLLPVNAEDIEESNTQLNAAEEMQLTQKHTKDIVRNELETLDKAIDYAESNKTGLTYAYHEENIIKKLQTIHSGQQVAYNEFIRVAWGKAIRLKSELKGEVIYRVSQAAAIIPSVGVATPQSPVGRLVNIARPGDDRESKILGGYSVEDVWYFQRYIGHEFVENIRNFKNMSSQGQNEFSVDDLREWLKNFNKDPIIEDEHVDDTLTGAVEDFEVEFSEWEDVVFEEDQEEEVYDLVDRVEEHKGISLSTRFYVNLSEHQYDAAHWGAKGLVFVFGVAGSGKTSVALGRSKSLSQLAQLPKNHERFNQDFLEETQIGVVRTGELIRYLKDTCSLLSLHQLPVVEYREIFEELKSFWDIDQTQEGTRKALKYMLSNVFKGSDLDSRMKWFHTITDRMLDAYKNNLLESIDNSGGSVSSIDGDIFEKINNIIKINISRVLENAGPIKHFLHIENTFNNLIESIFDNTIWIGIPEKSKIVWLSDNVHNIVDEILSRKRVICRYDHFRNLEIIIPGKHKDNWSDWVPENSTIARNSSNSAPVAINISAGENKQLSLKVITPDDSELLRIATNGSLRFFDGIEITNNKIKTSKLWLVHMPRIQERNDVQSGAEKQTREWRKKLRSKTISNVKKAINGLKPVDLYVDTILNYEKSSGEDKDFIQMINFKNDQFNNKRMDENDIDFLLAFMAATTRGLPKDSKYLGNNILKPAPYRSSVFIDEVQDFSEIQIFLLSMLSNPKYDSVTAVGDSAQSLYRKSADVSKSFSAEFWKKAQTKQLMENIRQQGCPTLNALSAEFRATFIDDIKVEVGSFARNQGLAIFNFVDQIDQLRQTYRIISNIPKNETLVIVVPNVEKAKEAIKKLRGPLRERQHRECSFSNLIDLSKRYVAHVTTPKNIKGLEFDHLIALYIDDYNLNSDKEKHSLYVMMSRSTKTLSLLGNLTNYDTKFTNMIRRFADVL